MRRQPFEFRTEREDAKASRCHQIGALSLIFFIFSLIPVLAVGRDGSSRGSAASRAKGFYVIDPNNYLPLLREDFQWAIENVPFIDFPQDDDILTSYYYRWRVYRKRELLLSS